MRQKINLLIVFIINCRLFQVLLEELCQGVPGDEILGLTLTCFFLVAAYSDTMQQAMFVMWFFVVSIMLLSGLFTPTRSMPQWAYLTTYINPMHYFIDAIRTVFIRGGSLHETAHQILALAGIGTLMGCWAVQSYKKNS